MGLRLAIVALALLLVALGSWVWRAAPAIATGWMDAEDRRHHRRVLRRGAVACVVVAAILVYFVIDSAVD
jgi:hypothetical protein